jgi:hypothetical protein
VITATSGSGPFGADAQIAALGQPWQLAAFPACSLCGPTQCPSGLESSDVLIVMLSPFIAKNKSEDRKQFLTPKKK